MIMNSYLAKIYAYKFFDDLLFIYPLYAVMFIDFGLNALQISVLLIVWSGTAFLLEVPSGVIADMYSRKYVLFCSQLIRAVGLLIWFLYPTFIGFLAGFVLWGIKSALSSGTFEALVYDELKQMRKENQYAKIIGRAGSFTFIAQIVASISASAAILLGYPFVLTISIGSVIAAALIILLLPSVKQAKSLEDKRYFKLLKQGLVQAVGDRNVLRIIIFLSIGLALSGALDEYWTIYVNEVDLPKYFLGLFLAAWAAVQAIGSAIAFKFEKFSDNAFYILFTLNGILLLFAGILMKPAGLLLLLAFSFLFSIIGIVFQTRLQHAISSDFRATIFSVKGFFVEAEAIIVYLTFGIIANSFSYQCGYAVFGIVILTIGLLYLLFSFGKKKLEPEDAC